MYILKNAWISISRNKGRNILIGIIILIIAAMVTVALAINNTADNLIGSYQSAYDKEVTISFDRKEATKDINFNNRKNISDMKDKFADIASYSASDLENFANSEHIKSYHYTYSTSLNGKDIEKATANSSGFDDDMRRGMPNDKSQMDFAVTGYSSVESMSEFVNGQYQITEITDDAWNKIFNGNYVFINSELASYNNLGLGSKIHLEDENNHTFSFTIVGIFSENSEEGSMAPNLFSNSANNLITNTDVISSIIAKNSDLDKTLTPTFIIDDYSNVETIQNEFYEKGLDKTFVLTTNEETANSGLTSIKNVQTFANTFLVIALIIGSIILFTVNMINIRERKYEIGVFRTIGVSKAKLTAQFVSELFMVSFVALTFGAIIGAVSSKNISNSLLESEISSSETHTDNIAKNFGKDKMEGKPNDGMPPSMPDMDNLKIGGAPTISAYDSIDAVVGLNEIFELLGIGLVLVLVSSLASMINIQKFSPLTILRERS